MLGIPGDRNGPGICPEETGVRKYVSITELGVSCELILFRVSPWTVNNIENNNDDSSLVSIRLLLERPSPIVVALQTVQEISGRRGAGLTPRGSRGYHAPVCDCRGWQAYEDTAMGAGRWQRRLNGEVVRLPAPESERGNHGGQGSERRETLAIPG